MYSSHCQVRFCFFKACCRQFITELECAELKFKPRWSLFTYTMMFNLPFSIIFFYSYTSHCNQCTLPVSVNSPGLDYQWPITSSFEPDLLIHLFMVMPFLHKADNPSCFAVLMTFL